MIRVVCNDHSKSMLVVRSTDVGRGTEQNARWKVKKKENIFSKIAWHARSSRMWLETGKPNAQRSNVALQIVATFLMARALAFNEISKLIIANLIVYVNDIPNSS